MKHCIYCHTNKINNKKYIGQTKYIDNPNERWGNGKYYQKHEYFFDEIIKYGWLNFEHNILETNIPSEEIDEKERYYIELYNTTDKDFGYNSFEGGKNSKISDYVRKKISNSIKENFRTGKQVSWNKGLKGIFVGEKAHFFGKHHTDETKKHLQEVKNCTKVLCVETGIVYNSMREAERKTGTDHTGIKRCCIGKNKTANGYHWEFANKEEV